MGECPIVVGRASIDNYSQGELVTLIRWIESDTLLRTEAELQSEAIRILGFARRGVKITNALNSAIELARHPSKDRTKYHF